MILQESQSIAWSELQACSAWVLPLTFPFTVCILCSGTLSAIYLPVSPIYCFPQSLQLIECIVPLWCWKGMGVFEASQAIFVGDSWIEKYFMLYGSRILQIRSESPSESPCLQGTTILGFLQLNTCPTSNIQTPHTFCPCSLAAASSFLCFRSTSCGTH